ncbi:hypothetical protein BCR37DRAFT_340424, partial [Protomyces lactucae-debilis]
ALLLISAVAAHEHHTHQISPDAVISDKPIDAKLWMHIILMLLSFGIFFPLGVALGVAKSRWHVPVQILSTGLAAFGIVLAHTPRTGRQFRANIHAKFAPWLILYMLIQIALGFYLRLHLERGLNKRLRAWIVPIHGVLGKFMPLLGWIQMGFGGITALGFCRNATGDHLGQCLAHGIMGSAFVAYGICFCIMLTVPARLWLQRKNVSQELLDSSVIMAWGLVNALTEHRWGQSWSHSDLQHTSMGIIWFCAGIAGIFLSMGNRRNVVPAAVILLTGWAMSRHKQRIMLSTDMHAIFGHTLMAAGVTRIVEVAVLLRDQPYQQEGDKPQVRAFQYIPCYLLVASGLLFMFSNEEQLVMINDAKIDAVSYSLLIYSLAFLVVFFANFLIHV